MNLHGAFYNQVHTYAKIESLGVLCDQQEKWQHDWYFLQ